MIPSVLPGARYEIEGLAGIEQAIAAKIAARAPRPVTFEVHTGGARGAAKNALIARVQAALGRNLGWISPKTMAAIKEAARDLASATFQVRRAAEERIKTLLIIGIHENVRSQKNPDGSRFRPLSPDYLAAKRRKYGAAAGSILKATGDLLGGLKARVVRDRT